MTYSKQQLWRRFQQYYTVYPELGLALDLSRMNFPEDFIPSMEPKMQQAFESMRQLEKGALANPDERRMVGHYWLRNPALAPTANIRKEVEETVRSIKQFASDVHAGKVAGPRGAFRNVLLIGIGGSALGPQFVAQALGQSRSDKMRPYFLDNTDPDGIDNTLSHIDSLPHTIVLVVSKSGGTKETRNGMLETQAAFKNAGLDFARQAVAITSQGSQLDKIAQGWLARFPMWDWVGGRTSELSAVGLLPAALQGLDIDALLAGARATDEITRKPETKANPAAQLALMWYYSGNGKGTKNMVVLPYKDRLELFSKYLQQLLMESLGKALDLNGNEVHQGITVFGNKGSTDQHSYIQQLRDGLPNFFVTFIEVLKDRQGASMQVEPGVTSGDFLQGFLLGTRQALYENGRESVTLTVTDVSPFRIGALIALFERTVGFYASLININAYHQPGVEAGKKAAADIIDIETRILGVLEKHPKTAYSIDRLANELGINSDIETVFKICEHLANNPDRKVTKTPGKSEFAATYEVVG